MSSRIDAYTRMSPALLRNDALDGGAPVRRPAAGSPGAASASKEPNDRVSVSDEARRLAGQAGTESSERVARLRAAIESGAFEVDAAAIAERMLHGD